MSESLRKATGTGLDIAGGDSLLFTVGFRNRIKPSLSDRYDAPSSRCQPTVTEPASIPSRLRHVHGARALVIIAVLIAASSFVTLQESQAGQNQLVQSRAFAAAEYGLKQIQRTGTRTPNLQMTMAVLRHALHGEQREDTAKVRMSA